MAAGRLASTLALAATGALLVQAQEQTLLIDPSVHGIRSYGQLSYGPYGLNADNWAALGVMPDSKQDFKLSGFNVSQRFPGTALPGWTVTLGSKANIALPQGALAQAGGAGNFFSGLTVRLTPPPTLTGFDPAASPRTFTSYVADDSWLLCATIVVPDEATSAKLADDDGSCSTILSADCVQAMELAISNSQASSNGAGGTCRQPDLSRLPANCQIPGAKVQTFEVPMSFTPYSTATAQTANNAAMKMMNYLNGSQVAAFGTVPAQNRDDRDSLNNATTFAIPMAFTFGPRAAAVTAQAMQMQAPVSKMICPSAVDKAKKFGGPDPGTVTSIIGMVLPIGILAVLLFFASFD